MAGGLNDQAIAALRRAMALCGTERNLSGFARKLGQVEGGAGTTHSSVRRWLEGGAVPAWALMAAAEAAGTSVGSLLEETRDDLAAEVARQADEIKRLWAAVGGGETEGNPLVDRSVGIDVEGTRRALDLLGEPDTEDEVGGEKG